MRFRKKEEKVFALKTLAKSLAKKETLNLLDIYSTFGSKLGGLITYVEDNREYFDEIEYENLLDFFETNQKVAAQYSSSNELSIDELHIRYQKIDPDTKEVFFQTTDEDAILVYEELLNHGIKPTTENMYQALKRYAINGKENFLSFHETIEEGITGMRKNRRRKH